MNHRAGRLAALSTALLVGASGALALGVAPAQADELGPLTAPVQEPAGPSSTDAEIPAFGRPSVATRTPATALEIPGAARVTTQKKRKHQWPVRLRTGTISTHTVAASGDASQRITSVGLTLDRLVGRFGTTVTLQGAPTPATDSRLRIGFGRVVTVDGARVCREATRDLDRHTSGTSSAYQGARISYSAPVKNTRKADYDCGFAMIISADGSTLHDAVVGTLAARRQKPALGIFTKGRKINSRTFTRVPVTIRNSKKTIATAPGVRLSWRTKNLAVRGNRKVGKIKPGGAKKGAIFVRKTGRGQGKIWLTIRSKSYKRTVVLKTRTVG